MRFVSDKLRKLVSTSTRYGGARAVLWVRKSAVGVGALRVEHEEFFFFGRGVE